MANSAGFLQESIWRDHDFRALPRTAQTLYAQLVSQKELDRAGILPLQVAKWTKGCDELTEAEVWRDLAMLEDRRFVFVDTDTDEALVRSYMRNSNVVKQPNLLKNALKCAALVGSLKLRHELAVELRRLRRADAARVADEIDPGEPIENPSGTVPEPIGNGSGTHREGLNPSGTLREPRGEGEGVGEGSSSLLVTARERVRANSNGTHPPKPAHDEPPRFCPRHPDGTVDRCGACGDARKAHDAWTAAEADRVRADAADRRAAIAECALCDDAGWRIPPVELDDPPVDRCDHQPSMPATWLELLDEVTADA